MRVRLLKPKKCRYSKCGKSFDPKNSLQIVCDWPCAIAYNKEAEKIKLDKAWREESKIIREELKTLSDYEKDARKFFQSWIRKVRDKDRPCISCGVTSCGQFDAGHYFSANQFSGLIFDEQNVHKQCTTCNNHHHGNLIAYRWGIINRYGEEYLKELEAKKDAARVYKFTKQELIDIKVKYQTRLKELGIK